MFILKLLNNYQMGYIFIISDSDSKNNNIKGPFKNKAKYLNVYLENEKQGVYYLWLVHVIVYFVNVSSASLTE